VNKRPLTVISVFFILGIVLARFLPDSIKFLHIFIITLIFILSSFIVGAQFIAPEIRDSGLMNQTPTVRQRLSSIFLFLSVTSFAALLYVNSNVFSNNHISHFLGEEKLKTSIVGVIKSPALTRKPYYGKINSTYLFEIETIKEEDDWRDVKGLSQIRIQTEKDYEYGDRLLVRGTIRRPGNVGAQFIAPEKAVSGLMNQTPTVRKGKQKIFDYREYLERQNIFALVNTKENNVTVLDHDYKLNPILKYTYLIRERLKNQFIEKMPLESGAFLRAILLGDRSELPKDIQASFKKSGTIHILPTQCRGKYNYTLESHVTICNSIS